MIETVTHRGNIYPKFQTTGNAARFCMPFALEVCKGVGFDIGYSKEEWKMPGAIGIEPDIKPAFHARNLPDIGEVDYIFSSHCLEHTYNWVECLDYWTTRIKKGGVLFLYLPDYSQSYWRPYSNRKHIHSFRPEIIEDYLKASDKWTKIFVSGIDAYNSFTAFAEKIDPPQC